MGAMAKLEANYKDLLTMWCLAHLLSLLFKNIVLKVAIVQAIYVVCRALLTHVSSHDVLLSAYRGLPGSHALDQPADTRMGTAFLLMQSVARSFAHLKQLWNLPAVRWGAGRGVGNGGCEFIWTQTAIYQVPSCILNHLCLSLIVYNPVVGGRLGQGAAHCYES